MRDMISILKFFSRLDRKSSRGMLYENEELRLRTININAEVDRGQSDIRKLRRENEQLRREIWCLRDEYDKLDKLLGGNRSRDLAMMNSPPRPEVDDNEYYSDVSETITMIQNWQIFMIFFKLF